MKKIILITAVFGFANSEAMLTNCMKDFSSNVGEMALQAFGRNFVQAATQNQMPPKNSETSPINEAKVLPQQNNGDQNVKKLVVEVTLDPKYDPLIKRLWLLSETFVRATTYSSGRHINRWTYDNFILPLLHNHPTKEWMGDWIQNVIDIFPYEKQKTSIQ